MSLNPSSLPLPLALVAVATLFALAIASADEHVVDTAPPPTTTLLAASPPRPQPSPATNSPPPPPPPPSSVNPPASWSPVTNVNDRTIQQVGKFAVHAYCLNTGAQLVFVSVVGGQAQPYGGGARYQLVITVAGDGPGATTARYGVSVWGILGTTTWQLWSFAPANN